jgi:hypothetical protein
VYSWLFSFEVLPNISVLFERLIFVKQTIFQSSLVLKHYFSSAACTVVVADFLYSWLTVLVDSRHS